MQKLASFCLLLGTALLPIYVFSSGTVQPTHMFLASFAGVALLTNGIPLALWSLALFALFLFSFAVESIYIIVAGNSETLMNSIFFLYNFMLVCAVYQYVRQNDLSSIVPGILIAGGLAFVTILVSGINMREIAESGRSTATFNNPNQLGYFSVCLLSLVYLFYRHERISYPIAVSFFGISLFLAIASLSKAAMLASFAVILLALKPGSSRNSILVWSFGMLVGVFIIFRLLNNGYFDEFLFIERLANMASEGDSSLESRGYFAFLEGNFLQMLFGLGAQGVADIIGHEVHSTLGSVLNNYGLFGLLAISIALVVWALRLWQAYGLNGMFCLAAPAMLYGITHNGLRFSIFWVLFATSLAMARNSALLQGRHACPPSAHTARSVIS